MEAAGTQSTQKQSGKAEKRYSVTGFIAFETINIGDTLDPTVLHTAIFMADSARPWIADNARRNECAGRADLKLEAPVVTEGGNGTLHVVGLEHDMRLSMGQLGAYEKYLRALAAFIAKAGLPIVNRVYSRMNVCTPLEGFVGRSGLPVGDEALGAHTEGYEFRVVLR